MTEPIHHTASGPTNDEWLAGLRSNDASGVRVQQELRAYLSRGLARAFGPHGGMDDASIDDVTQEALVRITTNLESFRGDSRFTTWAMAIAIRSAYTWLRRRRWGDRSLEELGLGVDTPAAVHTAPALDPTHPTGRADLLDTLREAVERDLSPRQRAAILGELAGMPTAVLAEQLGTNPNAFYKLHHDARRRLRRSLEERGFSEADVKSILQGAAPR